MNKQLLYIASLAFVVGGVTATTIYVLDEDTTTVQGPSILERPHSEDPYLIEEPYIDQPEVPVSPLPKAKKEQPKFNPDSSMIYRLPPKKENEFDKYIKKVTNEEDVDLAFVTSAYLGTDFQDPDENGNIFATSHIRYPSSFADVSGGLPCIVKPDTRPLINSTFTINWVTEWLPSYPEGGADGYSTAPPHIVLEDDTAVGYWTVPSIRTLQPAVRPDKACALFVSIKKPNPAPIPGGKGAILQCPPTYVFVPERKEHFPYSMDEGKFVQFEQDYDGRIRIMIKCLPIMNGLTLYCQLVVADNRVDAGFIPTPMIEINIGNK